MMREMGWQVDEDVNRDKTGEADELEKLFDPKEVETDASAKPSILFRPLTSWPPKLMVSRRCLADHVWQFASESVHSFQNIVFTSIATFYNKNCWKQILKNIKS